MSNATSLVSAGETSGSHSQKKGSAWITAKASERSEWSICSAKCQAGQARWRMESARLTRERLSSYYSSVLFGSQVQEVRAAGREMSRFIRRRARMGGFHRVSEAALEGTGAQCISRNNANEL